jgi:hypothetical protein
MKDPALGRTRSERALGEGHPNRAKKKAVKKAVKSPFKSQNKKSKLEELRVVHVGQYDGPKASYGRYNVSKTASDGLNRQKRNMDAR